MASFEMLFLVSAAAGLLGSMTGMGGGVVLVPALTLLGLDIKHAIATSMIAVIATSSGAAAAYVRDRITNLKVGMFLEVFTILGAWVGAAITLAAGRQWLFALFGLVLLASAVSMWLERSESQQAVRRQDGFSHWLELEGSYYDAAEKRQIDYSPRRAYLAGPFMFGAGLIAGLLGIGAGALKVLIFDLVMGLPSKVSTTTSDLIIGVTALAGTSVYLAAGLIDPGRAAPVVLGVLAGAYAGTRLLVRLTNRTVRRLFVIVLLALGTQMVWRGVRGGQ
jgi:uncharacterized membrane protein YfcA